jgi:hypothetical protein
MLKIALSSVAWKLLFLSHCARSPIRHSGRAARQAARHCERKPVAMLVHNPEIGLGLSVALDDSEAIPLHRLRIVLHYTEALLVHNPKVRLGPRVALIGEGTNKPLGGRVVAPTERNDTILVWACGHGCSKAQHKNDGGEGVLECELHGL